MKINLATSLTLSRLAVIPLVLFFYWLPAAWSHKLSALLFTYACFTDWLDGYIARHFFQSSNFGRFLDPVADKLLVATVLVLLVGLLNKNLLIIPALVIIGREIIISSLREWMAEVGEHASVAVSWMGKIKTVFQMVALGMLLWFQPSGMGFGIGKGLWVYYVGVFLLYVASVLTLWSMFIYLKISWSGLTLSEE